MSTLFRPFQDTERLLYEVENIDSSVPQFWMHMACTQNDRSRALHVTEAKKQLYMELVNTPEFKPDATQPRQFLTPEEKRNVLPNLKMIASSSMRSVWLCDRMFRTTAQAQIQGTIDAPAERNTHWAYNDERAPSLTTPYFEAALMSYRPNRTEDNFSKMGSDDPSDDVFSEPNFVIDFQQFCNDLLGYQLPMNPYGTSGDVLRLRREAVTLFRKVAALNQDIFAELRSAKVFGVPAAVYTVTEAAEMVGGYMNNATPEIRSRMMQRIESRRLALHSARSTYNMFQERVNSHLIARRSSGTSFLIDLADDLFSPVSRFLTTFKDVSSLLQTCKSFSTREELLQRKPNLRIRSVLGCFPHFRQPSRDRKDVENGIDKAVLRGFVTTRQPIRLFIDFGAMVHRRVPLKKKPRKDGLSHFERDLDDDEYEDPPECKANRMPKRTPNPHPAVPQGMQIPDHLNNHAKFELAQDRRLKRWDLLEGPEEKLDRFEWMRREAYRLYFEDVLKLTVDLVYADTHEEVVNARYPHGIIASNQLSRDDYVFKSPAEWDGRDERMPAQCKFHVPHLSAHHQNRLFKLRITGVGKYIKARGGGDAKMVVFSESFEVNSRKSVVDNASKRTAAEEAKHAKKAKM